MKIISFTFVIICLIGCRPSNEEIAETKIIQENIKTYTNKNRIEKYDCKLLTCCSNNMQFDCEYVTDNNLLTEFSCTKLGCFVISTK